jgi:hypothetical protein
MTKAVWGARLRAGMLIGLALVAGGCGDLQRQGTGSSYLIINMFEGSSGAEPDEFGNPIISDVLTMVDDSPTFFNDLGRVTLTLGMKDPGGSTSPSAPTSANFITLSRYRVRYIRADGRNTPGVDVPYPFDGGLTATVGAGETEVAFTIVRHTAKLEAPLATLVDSFLILDTIAEVTFFGRDQTGREVQATGTILVSFGNFGDPE